MLKTIPSVCLSCFSSKTALVPFFFHHLSLKAAYLYSHLYHILYHLKENQVNIRGIISADGDGQFMVYFKQYLAALFMRYAELFTKDVPKDFLIRHLVGSFAETIKWWISHNMEPGYESVAHFYIEFVNQ